MIIKNQVALAQKKTRYSNVRKAKMAAMAISTSGQLIAYAHNTKACGSERRWSFHAEENLIKKLVKLNAFSRFDHINILIIRMTKVGISMAKPCKKCQELLHRYPVTIYYSDWEGKICNEKTNNH